MSLPTDGGHQLAVYKPPPHQGLDLAYLDDDLLAVCKPTGLLSVPGRGERMADSMATRVQADHPDALVVHRLDLPTSGLLLMARSPAMHRALSGLFQTRQVHKRYAAVLSGLMAGEEGEVDLPLITDWSQRPRQKVDHTTGKPALTRWRVLERDAARQTTRVDLIPVTGRSHQLRVHMMSIGHAIVGDPMYASEDVRAQAPRLLLHAAELALPHPRSGALLKIVCPTPF